MTVLGISVMPNIDQKAIWSIIRNLQTKKLYRHNRISEIFSKYIYERKKICFEKVFNNYLELR